MSDASNKPVPVPNAETAAFWEACARGVLTVQRCGNCEALQHYPRSLCTRCGSSELAPFQVSGNGTVRTFTVNRVPVSEAFSSELPYVVALIELAEGPTMMTNVVNCDPEAVHIGMPVSVTFEVRGDQQLPQFSPRSGG